MKIKQYLLSPRFTFNRLQVNLLTIVLLWIGAVGGSYWTLNKIIKTRAINDTTNQWLFNAEKSADYTANNIIVDNLGARPAESDNLFTNYSFEVGSSGWISTAIAPAGWVVVPGSSTFGTSDFLVMKYEAKCADAATPGVGLTGPADTTYKVYKDNSTNCTSDNSRVVTSLASGYPIAYVSQTDAIDRCSSITMGESNAHLIDNNEWMTIARNAEAQDSNWSLGTVGSGYLYAGHNDNSRAGALQASTNDANRAAFTDSSGITEALTTATNNNSGQSGTTGNQVRTFNLSNGQVIWDMAGNINEWTNDIQATTIDTIGGWEEMATDAKILYGSSNFSYSRDQGIGGVYGGSLDNGFLRGGGWDNTTGTGAFSLSLHYPTFTNSSAITGFRCASDPIALSQSSEASSGRNDSGDFLIENDTFVDSKIVQSINVGSDTNYDLTAFVYNQTSGGEGDEIDASIAVIYMNGSTVPNTKYTDAGDGWWKLTATGTGSSASSEYGVLVKAGKSVKVDDFYLTKSVNRFANSSFSENISGWQVGSVAPAGWVVVPGSSTFNTSDFLVMKYEAKCADAATPGVGLTGPADTTYKVYKENGVAGDQCTSDNGRVVTSLASGYPIAYVSQTDAIDRCSSITMGESNAHLIDNNEWMTIARNAEAQDSNWSLGTVGSGYLYAGQIDNSPTWALQASTNDTNRAAFTDVGGTTEALTNATYNNSGQAGTVGNQVRTFNLSNGQVIWDIAGNVGEWTNNIQTTLISTAYGWSEWNSAKVAAGARALYGPSSASYSTAQGMGQVYRGVLGNGFIRGGYWHYAGYGGAFYLILYHPPSTRSDNVGFRCASDPITISQSFSTNSGRNSGGAQKIIASAVADAKTYQTINLGDTSTYNLSTYVYDGTDGNVAGTVNGDIAQLLVNGVGIDTTYTDMGSGWWKLSTQITGANSQKEYGVLVKSNKTVYIDDLSLNKVNTKTVFTKTAYTNNQVSSWDSFTASTVGGNNAIIKYQFCTDDGSTCETGNSWQYWDGDSWESATNSLDTATSIDALTGTAMKALSANSLKISVKAFMSYEGDDLPIINSFTVGLTTDNTPPTNATNLVLQKNNETCDFDDNCWTKSSGPTFSWNPGSDEENGSGLKGYCLYLGTESDGNPAQSKGKLGTSPVSITDTPCSFIVSATELNLSTSGYLASALSNSDSFATPNTYFLNIKAIDKAGNPSSDNLSIRFKYDGTKPTNVTYISPASGNFSNVTDMSFSWPTSGNGSAIDNQSGILGWQYQINSTEGDWKGSIGSSEFDLEYIPAGTNTYTLTSRDTVLTGNNVIYFRSIDLAGNTSDDASIRTGNLSFGGDAPSFNPTDKVTINPEVSTDNSFSLSWPSATPSNGHSVTNYYYMTELPPSTLSQLQSNSSKYIDNGTSTIVSAKSLSNITKGNNTVYIVAVDSANNYSPSNYIRGTFELNSNAPDNVSNLITSDSSTKSKSQWKVSLSWSAPEYQGAGNLIYEINRSVDSGKTFTKLETPTLTGLYYVDQTPESVNYCYRIYTIDSNGDYENSENKNDHRSSGIDSSCITPTGKWTSPPTLSSGPEVNSITTRKSVITWSTDRNADSKIQYGTSSGSYGDVEPSSSTQVTSHSILLSGLQPGTTYYYKTKWTDEDGNTGTSEEKSFSTQDAPTVKDVTASGIGLDSATIQFTSKGSSKVKIYYGATTSFGGTKSLDTSTSETIYTVSLSDLTDGTKYYYKINTIDSDGYEYEGTVLDFITLPRPRISNVQLQELTNTAQTTIKVTWVTNTEISSIITFYPEGNSENSRDQVDIKLTKDKHEMKITGLLPQTNYILVVKGRDKIGNEAISDTNKFTTSTDSRAPSISGVKVEGSTVPIASNTSQESTAQLVISWNTDEPATSQVEFGEGTGSNYSQKTQEDSNLNTNHLVVISNLTPSKVYHLRTISKDKAQNSSTSIDTVTITPIATDNALNLVLTNLSQAFSFLGGIFK